MTPERLLLLVLAAPNLGSNYSGNTIVAVKKPEVMSGMLVTNRFDIYNTNTLTAPGPIIQPAINYDPVASNGYALFVTKGAPQFGANYQGGALLYTRLQWSGTNTVLDTNWIVITNTGPTYRDYYDLDITNVLAPEATSLGGQYIKLWPIGSRFAMSVLRGGFLWTCQPVGLNGTNGVFTNSVFLGDESGADVDRTGIQWLKLGADTAGGTLGYSAHGRAYDRVATTNMLWYHFPSIMVNCAGDMAMGFSGSGATNYISAFYSWRLADGTEIGNPGVIRAGTTNTGLQVGYRWGDYSATTLDPADDRSFWTIQQVAVQVVQDDPDAARWATYIARIKPVP